MERNDHTLTSKVNAHLQTNPGAGVYRKCRINRKDINLIIKATEGARETHRELTRPWGEDGWRMLPSILVMKYTNEMRAGKAKFEKAIRDIETRWPAIVAQQEQRLGPLFRWNDYPFVYSLKTPIMVNGKSQHYEVDPNVNLAKYYTYDYKMRPTPDTGHFILDLEKQTMDELKQQLRDENQKNLESSKLELWKRLFDPVKNMADICSNDKKIFKTLISNVKKQIGILKDLNVTNDTDLNLMLDDVRNHLTGFTSGQIRNDVRLKAKLGNKAQLLSDKMEGYMTGSTPK
jgi:hypothetical protein